MTTSEVDLDNWTEDELTALIGELKAHTGQCPSCSLCWLRLQAQEELSART